MGRAKKHQKPAQSQIHQPPLPLWAEIPAAPVDPDRQIRARFDPASWSEEMELDDGRFEFEDAPDALEFCDEDLYQEHFEQPARRKEKPALILTPEQIQEEDLLMLEKQRNFRISAERVAAAFAEYRPVQKVALFGSVNRPLPKVSIPGTHRYRGADARIPRECRDVDIAVWLSTGIELKTLQIAVDRVARETGVPRRSLDIHLFDGLRDTYSGRLCGFDECPAAKPECMAKNCGLAPFLRFACSVRRIKVNSNLERDLRSIQFFSNGNRCGRRTPACGFSRAYLAGAARTT